jgi:hypothetical protein
MDRTMMAGEHRLYLAERIHNGWRAPCCAQPSPSEGRHQIVETALEELSAIPVSCLSALPMGNGLAGEDQAGRVDRGGAHSAVV